MSVARLELPAPTAAKSDKGGAASRVTNASLFDVKVKREAWSGLFLSTASGRELGRRKAAHLKTLTFLPDNRTLAIAASDRTPAEPVCLCAVPDL